MRPNTEHEKKYLRKQKIIKTEDASTQLKAIPY
jgi:hypothetical protein